MVLEICPNVPLVTPIVGAANNGWLQILKASARNCSFTDSFNVKFLVAGTRCSLSKRPTLYFLLKCKLMSHATLSAKNQIVIPRDAREALGVKPGDQLLVVVRGDRVIVLQEPKAYHAAIRGLASGHYPTGYLKKERDSWT